MGKTGIIMERCKENDNAIYYDIVSLFKIYRTVNWQMQVKVNQVKHRFSLEYGTDVDSFLDSIY